MSPEIDSAALRRSAEPLLMALGSGRPDTAMLADHLATLVAAAVTVLGVDGVGLMLVAETDVPHAVGASDATAAELETAQTSTGIGPGIDTLRTGRTVAVDDLDGRAEYHALATLLTAHQGPDHLRAVLSSPVRVGERVLGNFNATLRRPHTWTVEQQRANDTYADLVALALGVSATAADADERVSSLRARLQLHPRDASPDEDG